MIAEHIYSLLPPEWPLIIGDLPTTNTNYVGILEYDGATSTEYFGPKDTSSIYAPIIKIAIRNTSYSEGQEWAQTVKRILHKYHDDYLISVLLVGSPMYLGKNVEKFHEFQIVFRTQVKE